LAEAKRRTWRRESFSLCRPRAVYIFAGPLPGPASFTPPACRCVHRASGADRALMGVTCRTQCSASLFFPRSGSASRAVPASSCRLAVTVPPRRRRCPPNAAATATATATMRLASPQQTTRPSGAVFRVDNAGVGSGSEARSMAMRAPSSVRAIALVPSPSSVQSAPSLFLCSTIDVHARKARSLARRGGGAVVMVSRLARHCEYRR
jgi:hypothetical protein